MKDGADKVLAERQSYLYRQFAAHLHATSDYSGLFALLERPGFLSKQAELLGLRQSGEDLELYALPAAIHSADWDRFLTHALKALNLRGLAEATTEEPVLRALARSGRLDVAEDAVARLSDPFRRAAARAVLAAACQWEGERSRALVRAVADDLEAAAASTVPAPEMLASLCTVARRLGPQLAARWGFWQERLAARPEAAARLAWAVAEGYLEQAPVDDSDLWQALTAADPMVVRAELPERLGARLSVEDKSDVGGVLARLRTLLGSVEHAWLGTVRLLAQMAAVQPDRALAAWEGLAAISPVPWSASLVESGEGLFCRISPQRLDELAQAIDDRGGCAAVRVLALAAEPSATRMATTLAAVSALPDGPARLHWSLRYVAARPPGPETERQLGAILVYLRELRYDADPADCARCLDLAAGALPRRSLDLEVEAAVFSPARLPEVLRILAGEAGDERVLESLLLHVERYAAAVSGSEAEAFLLRTEVISCIARRLCLRRRDLAPLKTAIERLLPEEEDRLRTELTRDLLEAGEPALARQVAEGIQEPRLQLAALLPALQDEGLTSTLGDPAQRYRTLASVEAVRAELSALSALLEVPVDPRALAQRYLVPLRDREIQTQGLLRLGWHCLAFERAVHAGREDRAAVLELVRATLAVAADDQLVRLTPEIAALGAQRGGTWPIAEIREGVRRVAALIEVPWTLRRDALEEILSRLGPLLFISSDRPRRRELRGAAEVAVTLLRLPLDLEPAAAREEIKRRWDELLPLLIAAFDRLPAGMAKYLAGIPALWPGWDGDGGGGPEWHRALGLCLAPRREREREAERCLSGSSPDPAVVRTLAYLLAASRPQRVLELVGRLPPAAERDALCLRLLRHGRLPAICNDSLIGFVIAPEARLEADVERPPGEGETGGRWIDALARLATGTRVDPAEPGRECLVRRLWGEEREGSRAALAGAVIGALRTEGRRQGEAALRLWLHAHLAPQPGHGRPDLLALGRRAEEAAGRALSLSPEAP